MQPKKFILALFCVYISVFSLRAKSGPNNIVACVNDSPVYLNEYERLFKSQLEKFEEKLLFDPWQASSLDRLEERSKLIKLARSRNLPIRPADIMVYKNSFNDRLKQWGSPVNTYDLNSYAEDNAVLLQLFSQEASHRIQDTLIEKELILQEARRRKINVATWEIEQRFQEVKSKQGNESNFREFLRRNNSTELELKASLEEQILTEKLKTDFSRPTMGSSISAFMISQDNDFEKWLKQTKQSSRINLALPGSGKTIGACSINPVLASQNDEMQTARNRRVSNEVVRANSSNMAPAPTIADSIDKETPKLGIKKWFNFRGTRD